MSNIAAVRNRGLGGAGGPPGSWRHHVVATIALGLPLVGAQLAQVAINTTDVVMLGRYGTIELAASVLATQSFFFFYIFGVGFTNAVMPLAATAHGRDDVTGVRRSVRMGLWVVTVYAAAAMVPLWHIEAILIAFGQDPVLAGMAGDYMHVAQWGLFPALYVMGLRSFLSAIGRAQMILWAALAGTLANGILDYAFIFGELGAPRLGLVGAAIASLGSNLLIFAILAWWALGAPALRPYEIFVRLWRADWPVFSRIVHLGLPISVTIIAEVGLFIAASLMMGWVGTLALAAHGIAIQLASIVFMIPLGLSQAATVRVGQALGRDDRLGLDRAAKTALAMAAAVGSAAALIFWVMPETLIGLFLDSDDAMTDEVLAIAVPLLAVAAAFQVADGLQAIGAGVLRGLQDTRVPMVLAVFSYWVIGLGTAYGLGFLAGFGGVGIWSGLAVGLASAAVLLNWRFVRREAIGLM